MSRARGVRQPEAISPEQLTQQAAQLAVAGARPILGFERAEFAPFFDIQRQLAGRIAEQLVAPGQVPAPLARAFEQRLAGQQALRGLATSPVGAGEAAVALAGLSEAARQQALGQAQQFVTQFRPAPGFLQPLQPSQTLQLATLRAQQQRQAFAAREAGRTARRATFGGQLGQAAGFAGGLLGGPGGFALGALGGLAGQFAGGPGIPGAISGGLLGTALPGLFQQSTAPTVTPQTGTGIISG